MTIQKVMDHVQRIRNEKVLTNDFIIEKINEIEWRIKREIVDVHEGHENVEFNGYSSADVSKTLLAPEPYSSLYEKYILYQLDLIGNESFNATNSHALFNKDWYSFAAWYKRNHMPLQKAKIGMKGYYI